MAYVSLGPKGQLNPIYCILLLGLEPAYASIFTPTNECKGISNYKASTLPGLDVRAQLIQDRVEKPLIQYTARKQHNQLILKTPVVVYRKVVLSLHSVLLLSKLN